MSDEMQAMDDQNAGGTPMMGNDGDAAEPTTTEEGAAGSTEEAAV
jgi:hypothetical protein